jgi:aminopeptidase N
MKKFPLPILFSLVLLLVWQGQPLPVAFGQTGPAILRHDLHAILIPGEKTLQATDTLTVAPAGEPRIVLFLAPAARIERVLVNGKPASHYFSGDRLTVDLQHPTPKEAALLVEYHAVFDDAVPEAPLHSEDPTYGVAAAITPEGTFLSGSAGWYPHIPGSSALFMIRVEGPKGTEGVTSGRLVERCEEDGMSFSVWETSTPLPSLTLSAGPYQVRTGTAGEIPVYAFFRPETSALAPTYIEAAKGYLELYRNLFGPYPFEKFAVVENFFPTGYGFPSWTLLGSTVVRLPFIVETSLGHEIAHSWWGTGVRVDYSEGNWSEGLTTYVADHLYKERSSAEEGREYRQKILRDYATLVSPPEDFPLSGFTARSSAAGQAIGYGKAAMVFHMLRRRVGDENFWAGLRETARENLFREVSWSGLIGSVGQSAGHDLSGFFRQWVRREGAPVLRLEGVNAGRNGDRWEVSGRLRQEAPFFHLTVPLRLDTETGPVETTVELRGESSPFTLAASAEPRRLIADPGADLFRRLDPSEIPPTVNGIRGSKNLLVVVSRTLPPETAEAAATLLAAMRQDGARIVPEEKVRKGDLSGHDLLFLGFPASPDLLPPLPETLRCTEAECTIKGERFTGAGTALFAALPHPLDPEGVAAVFAPFSAEAALASVRKIPHYGKYSYLVFDSGKNRGKGTWPVAESPLIHHFVEKEAKP